MEKSNRDKKDKIKVGICVAYDWYLLKHSLPLIYADADNICLSIDRNRISFSGKRYEFDENGFRELISLIDKDNKISILEDNFHIPGLSPIKNEHKQRSLMTRHLGEDGWHIQIDCDEYFYDFHKFSLFLKKVSRGKREKQLTVLCPMVSLFKQTDKGFLVIDPIKKDKIEYFCIAKKGLGFEQGRIRTGFLLVTDLMIIHQSWARSEAEVKEKIYNWGHSNDFDKERYLQKWKKINDDNYKQFEEIHPVYPYLWPRLRLLQSISIAEMPGNRQLSFFPRYSMLERLCQNSSFYHRVRRLLTLPRKR